MLHARRALVPLLGTALLIASCAPGERTADTALRAPASEPSRTLVMVTDVEVNTLNPKVQGPTNPARTTRIFNAGLAVLDPRLRTMGYGRRFLSSLPPAPVTSDLAAVDRFFK